MKLNTCYFIFLLLLLTGCEKLRMQKHHVYGKLYNPMTYKGEPNEGVFLAVQKPGGFSWGTSPYKYETIAKLTTDADGNFDFGIIDLDKKYTHVVSFVWREGTTYYKTLDEGSKKELDMSTIENNIELNIIPAIMGLSVLSGKINTNSENDTIRVDLYSDYYYRFSEITPEGYEGGGGGYWKRF